LEDRAVPSILVGSAGGAAFTVPGHKPADHATRMETKPVANHASNAAGQADADTYPYPFGYEPEQIRSAYGINAIRLGPVRPDGSGQTIAIIDSYNDPDIFHDVNAFDKQFTTASTGPTLFKQYGPSTLFLKVVNQYGQQINPTKASVPMADPNGPGATHSWEREESLDVEWVHAIAPGAKIDLVECNSASGVDQYTAARMGAGLPCVSVVSMSFSSQNAETHEASEFKGETSYDFDFTTPRHHRPVTFLAATGDNGSPGGYPAYSPNVIAVGGTSLTVTANNSYGQEVGWSDGGGGVSHDEPEPAYQEGAAYNETDNPGCGFRRRSQHGRCDVRFL